MSVRISIYNKKAYREYTLYSKLNHADLSLVIDADLFWIEEDIRLKVETADGMWMIHPDDMYQLCYRDTGAYAGQGILLDDGLKFGIKTREGEELSACVSSPDEQLLPFEKYVLKEGVKAFRIGNDEESDIKYSPGRDFNADKVSVWADVIHTDDGVFIEPAKGESVYLDSRAVEKRTAFAPGQVLMIYGLKLCLLRHGAGDIFAVQASYGSIGDAGSALIPLINSELDKPAPVLRDTDNTRIFRRAPRQEELLDNEKVIIEEVPGQDNTEPQSFLQTIGNSLLMVMPMVTGCSMMLVASRLSGYRTSLFMYSGLVMALTSAVAGVIWGITSVRNQRKKKKDDESRRFIAYGKYLVKKKTEIADKYEGNTRALFVNYPALSECIGYSRASKDLWNRNESHSDFMSVRIGLADMPFQAEIEIPRDKFHLYEDELRDKPEYIKKNFETLYEVPRTVSFKEHRLTGLVGGEEKYGAYELARTLMVRLAATHCYTDVKLVFLYDEDSVSDVREWDFVRFLPHTWSEDRKMRYVAGTPGQISSVCYALAGIFRKRLEEVGDSPDKSAGLPYYVIFVSDPSLIEGELISTYIYTKAERVGLSTVILAEEYEDLPNGCDYFIENTQRFAGISDLRSSGGRIEVTFDKTDISSAADFARNITDIRVKEMNIEGELPDTVSFLDMYGADNVDELDIEERWLKSRVYENIRGMLGVKGGDTPVFLDVHEKYHGPHGLVAGTTGSGKSETLQTYLLSLAVNYSPDDVSYFIIDYKGGGMANLFDKLPHLAGSISNLSGAQIRRAMVSIKSENRRRQRLFNASGVNNINSYTRLYKNGEIDEPLPHLFIIIDEFAELKREEPDFMCELISVAQVGRSLGVHLILSTQKPSGTVDDNIWSNSRFKLCLRVQTKEDSMEMLGRPDAAYINQAGRCYLQVGSDELYELFQSGYTGAPYDPAAVDKRGATAIVSPDGQEELSTSMSGRTEHGDKIQLDAVIEHLGNEASRLHIGRAHMLWMPILKNPIYPEDFDEYKEHACSFDTGVYRKEPFGEHGEWEISTVIGQTDDPDNQAQDPLIFTLSEGHVSIIGAAMSGKSTLLTTMIWSLATTYSPDAVSFYCLDYSGRMLSALSALPHMGAVLYDGDEVKISRFFTMMEKILDQRKSIFSGGNYAQYTKANGLKLPAIVIAIDNFAAFNEKTKERFMPGLLRIAKEGTASGVFLILTGAAYNMNEIPGRISANIGKAYCLAMTDRFAYGDILHTIHVDVIPETAYKGRGLCYVGNRILEYQSALPLPAEDDYARLEKIKELALKLNEAWAGKRPEAVPEIPDKPVWETFKENASVLALAESGQFIPVGYHSDNAEIYSLDAFNDYCYMITGMPHTGKASLMRLLIYGALMKKAARIVLIDNGGTFTDITDERVKKLTTEEELYNYCLDELTPVFKARNQRKKELIEEGFEAEEYYDRMTDFEPVYIFITSLTWFTKTVYSDVHGMAGFMETLMKKGEGHKICFIGAMNLSERSAVGGYEAFNTFAGYHKGIHLGGNCPQNPYMSFGYLSNVEQAQDLPPGVGLLPDTGGRGSKADIVIPLAGRIRKKTL